MKKINKFLLLSFAFLVGLLFNVDNVKAYTATSNDTGWKYERQQYSGAGKHHASDKFLEYYIDSAVAYCIQPNVHPGTDNYIQGTWADTGLPDDIKERVILIGYYGYTYSGHQTLKYRAATQSMIWETIMKDGFVKISKDYWGKGQVLDFSAERAEIENLIAHHYDRPSFNGEVHKIQKGKSVVLTDTNNVLSQFDINVNGAEYSIDGNVLTITPNQDGAINVSLIKRMPYSSEYKLFVGDGIQNMLVPGTSDPVVAGVRVDSFSGSVSGYKKDKETGSIAQGQATLSQAEYGIYEKSTGNLVTTFVTDENGYFKSDNVLESKEYYIQEISRSEGYKLDPTRYEFSMVDKESAYVEVYEEVVKNYISILKQYDYVDGNTTILHPESNITFDIFYPDGRKFDTITTDKNGYASLTIPYGKWRFHQVNTNVGFSKMNDFYVTVDYNSKKEQYYNILNNKLNAYLQVIKKDSETGKNIAIANTTFKILNLDTNQYVSQYVAGKVYGEFKTDESGIFTTYLKLEAGNYKLIEVGEPNGYLLDVDGLEFNIGNDTNYYYTDYGATIVVEFENTPIKGVLEINKTGESVKIENGAFTYKKVSLEGIVFDVYASEDILTPDGKHLYYHKGDKVDTLTTNKDGYAVSKKLPLGKYFVVEISTKDGYVLDSKEYHFTLSEIDNKTAVVYKTHSKLNYLKKSELDFTKIDFVDDKPIEGALIEIYTENNDLVYSCRTDKNGKINFSFIDLDGKELKNTLPYGKYYIIEKEAPYNYLLNDDKAWFNVREDGEIIRAIMKDQRVEGTITIHKNGEKYSIADSCENPSMCFVYKTDNNLDGIKFGLYAREDIILNNIIRFKAGDLVDEGYTDEDGNLIFDHLYLGKYFIKELETKENYVLDEKEYDFELKYIDSKTPIVETSYTLKNYLIKSDLEFTKTDFVDDESIKGALIEIYTENNDLVYRGRTDKNGKIVLKNIPFGKFYILEKEAPYNYLLNEDKIWFKVKENGEIIKANMEDQRVEGTITIHKKGEKYSIADSCEDPSMCFVYETDENLDGIKFGLYAREDIVLNNIVRFQAGDLVDEGYTDKDGKLIFEHLYLGNYFLRELETKENYVLDEKEYDLELKYIDSKTPIVETSYTLKNYLIKSDLEFTKTSISDGTPLPNTLVEIYNESNELIFSGRTNEDGKIVLKNIPFGKFYILEKEAPESYVINEEPMWFEVREDGRIIKANMEDEKIKSTIIIHKADADGNKLVGVEIGIFDLENNLLGSYVTNENGDIEVILEYGSYYYQELKSLDGYILNEEKVYFNVTEHGAIIETTLINVKVPKTSLSDSKALDVIGIVSIIAGVGYLIYAKKKK